MHHLSKYFLPSILLISAFLGLLRFNSLQIGASYDDAHYMILAESLSNGQGYQLINFPRPQIERAFPPGWPILLAPLAFLFPTNYTVLKVLTLILWLASLFLIHKFFSKRIESPYLELLISIIAINPLLVGTSVTVMSESAYLFFSMVVFVLFDIWSNKKEENKYWLILLIAAAALYAELIRAVGISIFIALLIYLIISKRHFREAGITLGVFVMGSLIQVWLNLRNGGSLVSSGYESQVFNSTIIEKFRQMGSNMLGYFREVLSGSLIPVFGERVTSYFGPLLPLLANTMIILLLILGLIFALKKYQLFDIYFVIYILAILAFWNPKVGSVKARFLIPIIPFLYFYFIEGLKWSVNKLTKGNLTINLRIVATLAGMIMLFSLGRNLQDWHDPIRNQMTDLSIGADWVLQNTPLDSTVMVQDPVPMYVHLRRKTIAYPTSGQDLETYINNQGIDYIIIAPKLQSPRDITLDKFTETMVLPILKSNPGRFVVTYNNPEHNVTIYQYVNNVNQ